MKNLIFKFTDYIAPESHYESEMLIRARLFILMVAASALVGAIEIITRLVNDVPFLVSPWLLLLYIVLQIGFLVAIKLSKKLEWCALVYSFLVVFFVFYQCAFIIKSFAYSSHQLFAMTLVLGFLVLTDNRKRLALLLASLGFSIAAVLATPEINNPTYSFQNPTFLNSYSFTFARKILLILICMYCFAKVKDIGTRKLNEEMERRIESAKLSEISSLTRTYFPELKIPLSEFQNQIDSLLMKREKISPSELEELNEKVKLMKTITGTISWIYRAYRNDSMTKVPSSYLQTQLVEVLERKLKLTELNLFAKPHGANYDLSGPLPTVFLLQLKVLEQILAQANLVRETGLEFSMGRDEDMKGVYLRLEWTESSPIRTKIIPDKKESTSEVFSTAFVREETIRELVGLTSAKIVEDFEGYRGSVKIKGEWLALA